jgi:hypothetical protein
MSAAIVDAEARRAATCVVTVRFIELFNATVGPVLLLAAAVPVAGQVPQASLGILAGSQRLGAEVQLGVSQFALFGRAEGVPLSDRTALTAGARWFPLGTAEVGPYVHAGLATIACKRVSVSGSSTGCDGGRRAVLAGGAGVQIPITDGRFTAFAEGAMLERRQVVDIPDWTFAAGVRLTIR